MQVPLDLKEGLTTESAGKPLNWGIMGAGRVCHDFVQAMKCVPEAAAVQAIGCRELERSNAFAKQHGIPKGYGSYEEVAADPAVEICYVGMLHPYHYAAAMSAIEAGKHVLVEKPFTCSLQHAEKLVAAAAEKKVFIMEGMWTRFFPAVERVTELIAAGTLGDIVALHSDFGFNSSDVADYPSHQMFCHALGGGGLYYLGPYPVAAAVHAFGDRPPARVSVAGVKDEQTGVDMAAAISLLYDGGAGRKRGVASLTYNMLGESPEETVVVGTKGRAKILGPAHCPIALEVHSKRPGRGNVEMERLDFPLPEEPAEVVATGSFNYPNSIGFTYELQAIYRCIRAGLTYCPQYPPEHVLAVMRILDETRRQIGLAEVA